MYEVPKASQAFKAVVFFCWLQIDSLGALVKTILF